MTWVVDTCVVIDLVERDGEFSAASCFFGGVDIKAR